VIKTLVKLDNITDITGLKAALSDMARACPVFWKAVTGRRYLLPNYRQGDYFSQEYLDQMFVFFLYAYLGGDFGDKPDPVIRAAYLNQVMALHEKRPIYFLEKELGEVLMRTELPLDLVPNELHWIRRQFRVMLPRDLLSIERNGVRHSVMFLDLGKATANEYVLLDPVMEREVKTFARIDRVLRGKPPSAHDVRPVFTRNGLCISGQITQREVEIPGEHYACIRPFEDLAIRELIKVGEAFETTAPCDTSDDLLLEQMQHLAINILLFLAAVPLEYEPKELAEIRKLQVVNDRVIPSLSPAKFIGKQRYRAKRTEGITRDSTGRTNAAHWVKGFWRRQPYGPKLSQRKLMWIEPYPTGELRLDSLKGA
jgi:hypothetical protein